MIVVGILYHFVRGYFYPNWGRFFLWFCLNRIWILGNIILCIAAVQDLRKVSIDSLVNNVTRRVRFRQLLEWSCKFLVISLLQSSLFSSSCHWCRRTCPFSGGLLHWHSTCGCSIKCMSGGCGLGSSRDRVVYNLVKGSHLSIFLESLGLASLRLLI